MTDNEIKKALECCSNSDTEKNYCDGCPYDSERYCASKISKDTLDLINRQQAEIERYKQTYGCYPVWNVPCENVFVLSMSLDDYENFKNQIISEAYKEFAERLKDDMVPNIDDTYIESFVEEYIDNLVKEMVGEQK